MRKQRGHTEYAPSLLVNLDLNVNHPRQPWPINQRCRWQAVTGMVLRAKDLIDDKTVECLFICHDQESSPTPNRGETFSGQLGQVHHVQQAAAELRDPPQPRRGARNTGKFGVRRDCRYFVEGRKLMHASKTKSYITVALISEFVFLR